MKERTPRKAFDAAVDAAHRVGGLPAVLSVLRATRRLASCLKCGGDGRAAWQPEGERNSLERDLLKAAEYLPDLDFSRAPWVCNMCKGSGSIRAVFMRATDQWGINVVRRYWEIKPGSIVPHAYNRNCPMGVRARLDARLTGKGNLAPTHEAAAILLEEAKL